MKDDAWHLRYQRYQYRISDPTFPCVRKRYLSLYCPVFPYPATYMDVLGIQPVSRLCKSLQGYDRRLTATKLHRLTQPVANLMKSEPDGGPNAYYRASTALHHCTARIWITIGQITRSQLATQYCQRFEILVSLYISTFGVSLIEL